MSIAATIKAASTGLKLAAGAVFGALAMFSAAVIYNVLVDNPAIERAMVRACEADKSQMVSKATADALAAALAQSNRLRAAADQATDAARARADATAIALDAANDRLRVAEDEARKAGMPGWTAEELKWLREH